MPVLRAFHHFPNPGDPMGNVLNTHVRANINGQLIPSFNIDGNTMVVVEDLRYYGFDVVWDGVNATLSVTGFHPNRTVTPKQVVIDTSVAAGTPRFPYLFTSVETYVNGVLVDGFNIDGQTIIWFDHLAAYGTVTWHPSTTTISLVTR
jgi:hypothetical protein